MKYLKLFESKNYKSIDDDEYEKFIAVDMTDHQKIINMLFNYKFINEDEYNNCRMNKNYNTELDYKNITISEITICTSIISIMKGEDDYYYISIINEVMDDYYKCDQLSGLNQCLNYISKKLNK